MSDSKPTHSAAEASSVTPATVVSGLGFPNERIETSASPTGWIAVAGTQGMTESIKSTTEDEGKVSRETSK